LRKLENHVEVLTFVIEWEQKPSSPSSIRLISFGKLLDDKAPLKGKLCTLSRLDEI
jgi:hypothetical protein